MSSGTGFASGGSGGGGLTGDPKTCAEAAMYRTYLGCDFYPTVTANNVWSLFDYAVVVANAGTSPADVTVTKGGSQVGTATVQPNGLATIYLPWVPELKGPDADACGSAMPLTATVRSAQGAYHLVSSVPVTVYQFSALEYAAQGGPPGKNWGNCPGDGCGLPCFSYSNDASLLLPSTALTNNYRIAGYPSWATANIGSFVAITGTQDGTKVTVSLQPQGSIQGGGGVNATPGGGSTSFNVNQGEVVELIGATNADFSGSLVQGDKPIQVIHGLPCVDIPDGFGACDHIEESVFPAETLGKHYVVTSPTGPGAAPVQYVVRFIGNANGTTLTYPSGSPPPGAPLSLAAGQVVDLGLTSSDFEVQGDHEFAVTMFQTGASLADTTGTGDGDPAQSIATAVEQYRTKYVFLAPTDYDINFVDVVAPGGTSLTLDGAPVTAAASAIGASTFKVTRIHLDAGAKGGAHVLEGSAPFGIQVLGYGSYTSYQYPGGLNLQEIAPPPPPPA